MQNYSFINERTRTNEYRRIEMRHLGYELNPFDLGNTKFRKLFRVSRVMAKDLIDRLTPFLTSNNTCGLTVYIKVSIFNIITIS